MLITKNYLNELTYQAIGYAIEVHKHLGPGLLESVYEKCFLRELGLRNIRYHEAVLFSYMQMPQKPKGILINFHCLNIFKEGQKIYKLYVLYVPMWFHSALEE